MEQKTYKTATAAVRALGFNAGKVKQLSRERGALARTAREILPQVQAITPTGRFGRPITFDVVESAFQSIRAAGRNGHHTPAMSVREAMKVLVPPPAMPAAGDTIDKALGDLIDVVARIEGFVRQAQAAQAWLAKMRRELPEVKQ